MDTSPQWDWPRGRKIFYGVVIFFALLWIHTLLPVRIGCRNPWMHWSVMMLQASTFLIVLVSTLLLPPSRKLWIIRFVLSMPAALSVLPILGLTLAAPTDFSDTDQDPSFERIKEITVQGYAIRAYRTNGGATTDYGIVVRRESKDFGSFYLYKSLYSAYHQMEVGVSPTPDGQHVRISGNVLGRDTIAIVPI